MIYPFKCDVCGRYLEVYRPIKDAGKFEICEDCGTLMRRIFTATNIRIVNYDGYNSGLGCPQRMVRDKLKQIKDNTGQELVEIGNERIKPAKKDHYKLDDKEVHEIGKIIDGTN